MITLEKLKDLKDVLKSENCNSCGILFTEDDLLIRIKAGENDGDISSIYLCEKCAKKLLDRLESVKR